MDDLISRQSAIDLLKDWSGGYDYIEIETEAAINEFQQLPSVDAIVEVVRCKDCKNWDTEWQNDWAKNYHYCPLIDGTRAGDWFCADAERKEDG